MEKKEETKIPTAEEQLIGMFGKEQYPTDMEYCMIEFAKLHVQKALKQASEKAEMRLEQYSDDWYIDRSSILKAYPLENIK